MERGETTEDTKRNNEMHWQARQASKWLAKSITNEAMCFVGGCVHFCVPQTGWLKTEKTRIEVFNQGKHGHRSSDKSEK